MKEKSEGGQIFQTSNKMIQNEFQTKIQVLKIDDENEFFHSNLESFEIKGSLTLVLVWTLHNKME